MKKLIFTLLVVAAISPVAQASEAKKAVVDDRGNAVRSTNGNCVRHDWTGNKDICAPAPEPVAYVAPEPVPEPEPVAMLTKKDLTVYFDFNKSTITPDATMKLNNLVMALIESEGVESLSIVGYADRIGGDKYNLKLSEKRQMAVQDYINSKVDIPTEIVQASARGEANPVTDCSNSKRKALISCLAKDRRVEIVLNYFKM